MDNDTPSTADHLPDLDLPRQPYWYKPSLQVLSDLSPNAIFVTNRAGRIVLASKRAVNLFGYASARVRGRSRTIEEIIAPRFRELFRSELRAFFDDARTRAMIIGQEMCALSTDRAEIPVEITLSPLLAESKLYRIIVVRDLRRQESAKTSDVPLALINERLRLAMEASNMVGWDWDIKTGSNHWFGDLRTMFGMTGAAYAGHIDDFRRFIHPADCEAARKAVEDAKKKRGILHKELRILWPDGTVRWVMVTGRFRYGADGRPNRMIGMAADITDRKRTEETLHRRETELAEAQRIAGVGSWHWDVKRDVVTWSEELYRIAGRDPARRAPSFKEHPYLFTAGSWKRLRAAVAATLRSGESYELDLEMPRRDGTTRLIATRGEAVRDAASRIVELRGTAQDITEQRHAEEALSTINQKLIEAQEKERSRLARELHDDISQRLALLAVNLEPLTRSISEPELVQRIADVRQRIIDLGNDVQLISHRLHSSKLGILGLTAAARSFCLEFSEHQKVDVSFATAGVPKDLSGEVSLCLFRVLQEALHNAVKHSGCRRFEVSLQATSSQIELTVQDSGIGFDLGTAIKGRGLGLVSMKERLKLVDGDLCIDSKSAQGTTVRAQVPLRGRTLVAQARG